MGPSKLFYNPPPRPIRRHQRDSHPIPDEHPDVIPVHRIAQVRHHDVTPVKLHPHQLARQQLRHDALSQGLHSPAR
jgi:hypothetical protein